MQTFLIFTNSFVVTFLLNHLIETIPMNVYNIGFGWD